MTHNKIFRAVIHLNYPSIAHQKAVRNSQRAYLYNINRPPEHRTPLYSVTSFTFLGLRGFSPLIHQPRAKNAPPASMAVPQACEYHLLYKRTALFHCALSVTASGFSASGGFTGGGSLYSLCSAFTPADEDEEEKKALARNVAGGTLQGVPDTLPEP